MGRQDRTFKIPPVGNRKIELIVEIPRLLCSKCGAIKKPRLSFADPQKHYTRSLERFIVDLWQDDDPSGCCGVIVPEKRFPNDQVFASQWIDPEVIYQKFRHRTAHK